jgi:hypothetical protein
MANDPKQSGGAAYEKQSSQDYAPMAVEVIPENVTLATMNESNKKYWAQQGGDKEEDL